MKYMRRVYSSRLIVAGIAIAALGGVLVFERAVLIIALNASPAMILVSALFTGIAYLISWVIALCWKSNRDTMFHEMGDIELRQYEATIKQAIADREKQV